MSAIINKVSEKAWEDFRKSARMLIELGHLLPEDKITLLWEGKVFEIEIKLKLTKTEES